MTSGGSSPAQPGSPVAAAAMPEPVGEPAATETTALLASPPPRVAEMPPPSYDVSPYVGQPVPAPQPIMGPTYAYTQQPVAITLMAAFGPANVVMVCPNCRQNVRTETHLVAGGMTWLWFAICCLCCFICAWLPFVMKDTKDVVHTCPSCHIELGRYRRL